MILSNEQPSPDYASISDRPSLLWFEDQVYRAVNLRFFPHNCYLSKDLMGYSIDIWRDCIIDGIDQHYPGAEEPAKTRLLRASVCPVVVLLLFADFCKELMRNVLQYGQVDHNIRTNHIMLLYLSYASEDLKLPMVFIKMLMHYTEVTSEIFRGVTINREERKILNSL